MNESTEHRHFGENYGGSAPEAYERFFVPAIGLPLARDLIETAKLQKGEKVLDVACGTGVVARLAAEKVGPQGTVAGVDVNAGMLKVARSVTPTNMSIQWYESPAETLPLPDQSFDVVLCQLSFQFFADKAAALREMRRVLVPGGRLVMNVPGRIAGIFDTLAKGLARHIDPSLGGFVRQVFSFPDPMELRGLVDKAGFDGTVASSDRKSLRLPAPEEFLWQYVHSTPLSDVVGRANDPDRAALQKEVVAKWQPFTENNGLILEQDIILATATR